MKVSNFDQELAELRVEEEKQAAIASARMALSGVGQADCEECGRPIGEARRAAMPSATRCFSCQEAFETERRRVAR
ncbi:phage/conjugal plasmid C-4 type zinc finger TraR family protein [Sinorhizobium fredii]|uniref:TraR/DksA C4-type zinc finger protein n=1 Tax=Rhizobium fredii TaxID=380 RepID=UPI003510FD8B